MTALRPTVVLLDDDPSVLRSLGRLMGTRGYRVRSHVEAGELFQAGPPAGPACLLLDQNLGATTGLDVHAELRRRGWNLPTVFLTAQADTACVVAAVRGGADDFITKPYHPSELLAAVARALDHSERVLEENRSAAEVKSRAARLTQRERTIVSLVLAGLLNKQIAEHLGIALVTVKVHRGRAMRKLGARNAADLARLASLAGIHQPD
jgi:FixJ family two-component response regulator